MSDEWGPWVEHDGKGCPLKKGTIGEAELRCGRLVTFRALCGSTKGGPTVLPTSHGSAWVWGSGLDLGEEVVFYRVRKPRGLAILEDIARDVDVPQKNTETAGCSSLPPMAGARNLSSLLDRASASQSLPGGVTAGTVHYPQNCRASLGASGAFWEGLG